ncbi:hypothetical protein [Methylopila sp. 73B]|uniref:hypothetical protein n=1 Tax=Methylopila sp. 73B TaxID=1120792 RepID=UPI00036DEE7D|nr:hypothetical protein [Methylopila sp. 73B]
MSKPLVFGDRRCPATGAKVEAVFELMPDGRLEVTLSGDYDFATAVLTVAEVEMLKLHLLGEG